MNSRNDPSQQYLRNAVLTATPEQLQLMLYDGAIRFAARGREALEARQREAAFDALDRAQRIVLELANGINRDVNPPLADRMLALYNFIFQRLIDANVNGSVPALDDALRILRHQRETWVLLMEKLARELPPAAAAGSPAAATAPVPEGSSFTAQG